MHEIFTGFSSVNSDEQVDAFQIHKGMLKFVEDKSCVEDVSDRFKLYSKTLMEYIYSKTLLIYNSGQFT